MGLEADPRVREVLEVSPTWHTVEHHAEVGSTQDVALERLRQGVAPGLVVVADAQATGRGRLGRAWRDAVRGVSGPANLAVSATVAAPERAASLVPLVVGLAVADAYTGAGAQPRLKWPNDVLLAGRKAAGILVERHVVDQRPVLVIGCGLNLDWRGVERTDEERAWISVAEAIDAEVDRVAVLVALLTALSGGLGRVAARPDVVLGEYRARCATLGQRVRLEQPGRPPLEGDAVEVDADGRLVIAVGADRRPVDVGDVVHVRPA